MKKLLAILLALAMVFSLVACGDNGDVDVDPDDGNNAVDNEGDGEGEGEGDVTPAVEAEPLPDNPLVYLGFETTDGLTAVEQIADVGSRTGSTYGLGESSHDILIAEGQGAVGNALYLDGKYGVDFEIPAIADDSYTISFWYNADRVATFGPVVQVGRNIGMSPNDATVTWINFTKTAWGTNSADIFPVVWNRNSSIGTEVSDDGVWPWTCAYDDEVHGKREWCLVTLVVTGDRYVCADDGMERIGSQLYINGELVHEANSENLWYQGVAPEILADADGLEAHIGINYWDTVFKGFIDELYIFDEALTAGQVKTLFEQGNPPESPVAPEYDAGDDDDQGDDLEPEPLDAAPVDDSAIYTLGTPERTLGWWSENTDGYELADGATLTANFNLYSDGTQNYHTIVTALTNTAVTAGLTPSADNYDGYAEYAVVRSDAFGWGDASYADSYECSWGTDWASWLALTTDAKVEIAISRSGGEVTLNYIFTGADGTVMTETALITSTMTGASPGYVHFTGEGAYIELLSVN